MESGKGFEGMTDKQFLNHLREIMKIAEQSANLEEFKKALAELIENYRSEERRVGKECL